MNETTKRRTEITIETHSLTIIKTRRTGNLDFVFCPQCKTEVMSFPEIQAALIFRADVSEIERLLRINLIHFASDNRLCGKSLAEFYNREIRYVED